VARFKVVTPEGVSFGPPDVGYDGEMEALAPIGAEIVDVPPGSEEDFIRAARDCDALYAKARRITKRMIDGLERCRVIALGTVGVDSVDVAAATARGIPVTNVPDTFIEEVADHALMLILATYRRLTLMDRWVRTGRWAEGRPYLSQFPRLWGQTLGLISFGHVARAVAVRARPFGVRILAYDPYVDETVMTHHEVEPVGLHELLRRSDIVSMHAPATADAFHLLTEEHFRLMKRDALFVNTGRGPTVDEAALVKALEEGWIAGAGLDVFEQEPALATNPLLGMENVILTPHVASASARMDPERRRRVGREIALVLTGRWPMSCVNPAVLEKTSLRRWQPYSMERGPGV
jgi:D-3-phosphoglycerate dehydrogenase / 2-oxoglutarate reductase